MNISFKLKHKDEHGNALLYAYITGVKPAPIDVSLSERIHETELIKTDTMEWGYPAKRYYVIPQTFRAKKASDKVNKMYDLIRKYEADCYHNNEQPNRGKFLKMIQEVTKPKRKISQERQITPIPLFLKCKEEFLKWSSEQKNERGKGKSENYIYNQGLAVDMIFSFGKKAGIALDWDSFNDDMYEKMKDFYLDKHMNGKKSYSIAYFCKHMKHLLEYLNYGGLKEYHTNEAYKKYKIIPPKQGQVLSLSTDETKKLLNLNIDKENRLWGSWVDVVAMIGSGMYANDLYHKFSKECVKGDFVIYNRYKTNVKSDDVECRFPFKNSEYFRFPEMCELVNYQFDKKKEIVRDIRQLCKLAGIEKDVTPKVCRKTYATIQRHVYGASIKAIGLALGHSNEETTKKYLGEEDKWKLLDELK